MNLYEQTDLNLNTYVDISKILLTLQTAETGRDPGIK